MGAVRLQWKILKPWSRSALVKVVWTSEFWLPLKIGPPDPWQRRPFVSIDPSFGIWAAIIGNALPRENGQEISHCPQNLKAGTEVFHNLRNKKRLKGAVGGGQRQGAPRANLLPRIKKSLIHCDISQMRALTILTILSGQSAPGQNSKGVPKGKLGSWILLNHLWNPVLHSQQAGEAQRPCTFLESPRLSNN